MKQFIWGLVASVVSTKAVRQLLLWQATKTPYLHIMSPDGDDCYMERYWLLNPYDPKHGRRHKWFPWSVRIHLIRRPDLDRHLHDHPWNARTIILRGWYREQRKDGMYMRVRGDTQQLKHREYHRIDSVSPDGVLTLFITGPKRGSWGFLVDGKRIDWREYLRQED